MIFKKITYEVFMKYVNKYFKNIFQKIFQNSYWRYKVYYYDIICFGFKPSLIQKQSRSNYSTLRANKDEVKKIFVKKIDNENDFGLAGFFWIKNGVTFYKHLLDFSKWLNDKLKNQKDDVSAACNDFLKVLGYVALGFSWLKMTKVSFDNSSKNKNFYEEKINTAKYFFDKILPRIDSHYHSAIAGSESLMKAKFN